jgi:phosphate transport system protein
MPLASITDMAGRVCDALQRVLVAFARDDVKLARQIHQQASAIDQTYQEVAETIADRVAEKKPRHLERGAHLLNIAYYLKRGGERVTNIAERIIFVRTGALEDLDRED